MSHISQTSIWFMVHEFMSSSTFIYTVPDVTIQINNDHTHLDQHDQEDVPDTHNSFDQLEHTHDSK